MKEGNGILVRQASAAEAALATLYAAENPQALPLDHSFESLDRVEDLLRASPSPELIDLVAAYIGQTLIAHAGGRWGSPSRSEQDNEDPVITGLTIIPKARFYPYEVTDKATVFEPPVLREAVEHHDIAHRREVLATQLANLEAELRGLRDDVIELVGSAPEELDESRPTLDAIERALIALRTGTATREHRRRVRDRVVRFLGNVVQQRIGGGWSVCEDVRGTDVGEFESHGWAPASTIKNVGPNTRGIFERVLPLVFKRGTSS